MISIVICSYKELRYEQVAQSIDETIGVPYELIKIDNLVHQYGICKAYNLGAAQAKFNYICFMHEDIIFKSKDWGKKLLSFSTAQPNPVVIGVAGSTYKSLFPSGWAQGLFETDYVNVIQHYSKGTAVDRNLDAARYVEVVSLDGVFLFTHRDVWQENKFDEHTFDKFHGYDLDFSFQAGRKYQLFVSPEVLIEHFSSGDLNRDWVEYAIKLTEKWEKSLPIGKLPRKQQQQIEWRNRKIFFFRMNIIGYSLFESFKVFCRWGLLKNSSPIDILVFIKDLILRKLKLSDKPFY